VEAIRDRTRGPTPPVAFLPLSYFGVAYLVASAVGRPATTAFWLVFWSAVAILAPVVLLAKRLR
jgi:hypothetical protein